MRSLVEHLIKSDGGCCIYGYLAEHSNLTTSELARRLGVSPRTIRQYKQRIAEGKLGCMSEKKCYRFGNN